MNTFRDKFISRWLFWIAVVLSIGSGVVFYLFFSSKDIQVLNILRSLVIAGTKIFPHSIKQSTITKFIISEIIWLGGLIIYGIIMQTFFNRQILNVKNNIIDYPLNCMIVGVIGITTLIFLNVLLAISIIGVPMAVFLVIGFFISGFFGIISISLLIGNSILRLKADSKISFLMKVSVGLIVIEVAKLVPYIGLIIYLILVSIGLGSVAITRFGTITYPQENSGKNRI